MQIVIDNETAIENIARNVTFLLAERGWSQRKLATATGEPLMNINRLVNRKGMPSVGTLARIAAALHTSMDWLVLDHSTEQQLAS